jgi:acetyl-CoA carboxylase biotin carboxyl carrier protein
MTMSHDDIQRIVKLLDDSQFDELHLEAEGVKLTLRRNGVPSVLAEQITPASAATPHASPPAIDMPPATPAPTGEVSLLEVRAPMLGTFYGAPKPGAEPYVRVGAQVNPDSAVGIIEVMKLMNSISAGVRGVLTEVLVGDGDVVEFDQILMRVRPN